MGFYYFSILSIAPLGLAYGALALIFWAIVRATRSEPKRKAILAVVGLIFLVLPIGEELWIAWNFGQACKAAGTFIYKKVEVEGYYDDTGTVARIVGGPQYRFIESRERDGGYRRVERATEQEKADALSWYERNHDGKRPSSSEWIVQPVDDRVQIAVETNTGLAWKTTIKLDRPTARYHFRFTDPMNGTPVAHKVFRSNGSVVVDNETKQEIARYTSIARRPAWFFVSLDTPGFGCDSPGDWPRTKRTSLIYRDVLIPTQQK